MTRIVFDEADGPLPVSRFYVAMGVLFLAETFSSLENHMVIMALPSILKQFHGSSVFVWLLVSYSLVQAATAGLGGRLGDMFGRKRVLAIVIAFAGIGSLISALGESVEVIAAGRALQGVSGAILPLGYGITRQISPPKSAAFWVGMLTGGYAFSAGIGYVLGGVLSDLGTWRSLFHTTAGFAAVLVPLVLLLIPEQRGGSRPMKLDWLGAVLFAPAVGSILFGITMGKDLGWASNEALLPIVGGAALLLYWIYHEARHPEPMFNVHLFRSRSVLLGNLCGGLAGMSLGNFPMVIMLLFQQSPQVALGVGLGVSATAAGLLKLPSNASALIGAPYSGWVAGRWGARWSVMQGGVLGFVAFIGMGFFHDTIWQVLFWSVLGSTAMTIILAGIPNLVLEGTPMDRSSEATGLLQVVRSGMAGIGTMIIGLILSSGRIVVPGDPHIYYTKDAYEAVFLYIAALPALIAIICLFVSTKQRNQRVVTIQPAS